MELYRTIDQKKFQKIYEAIEWNPEEHRLISVVGAGGKTTIIETLAREIAQMGYRVVITTTTHMGQPDKGFYDFTNMPELNPGDIICLGKACEENKIMIPEDLSFSVLRKRADVILVEADGSKRKPLKVPAEHEPVIPENTDMVIGVLGFQSVGRTIGEVAHRTEDVSAFLKKESGEIVTVEDLKKISFHEKGILKHVECPYRIIWNRWKGERIETGENFPVILCREVC